MNYIPYSYCIIDTEFTEYTGKIVPHLVEVGTENLFLFTKGNQTDNKNYVITYLIQENEMIFSYKDMPKLEQVTYF